MKKISLFFIILFLCQGCSLFKWGVEQYTTDDSEFPSGLDELEYEKDLQEFKEGKAPAAKKIKETQDTPQKEFKRHLESAQMKNPGAQLKVAEFFETGYGTEKDPIKAYLWYAAAATRDLETAQMGQQRLWEYLSFEDRTTVEMQLPPFLQDYGYHEEEDLLPEKAPRQIQ